MTLKYDVPATEDKPATSVRVPLYQSSLLVAFLDYIDHVQMTTSNFETVQQWMDIITDAFTTYHTSSQYIARRSTNATPQSGPVHTLKNSLDEWRKDVKRDMTQYPTLKHDHQPVRCMEPRNQSRRQLPGAKQRS
jgi:hypothetical protein